MDNVNKWLMLAANLGVIAGIVFLGVEIQQNNQQLAAQARYNYYQQRANFQWSWGVDAITAEVIQKSQQGMEITPSEKSRVQFQIRSVLSNWEYEYFEYQLGNINIEQFTPEGKRIFFLGTGELGKEVWDQSRDAVPSEYVNFMEENVIY